MSIYNKILGLFWSLTGLITMALAIFATMPPENQHFLILVSLLSMLMSDNYYDKAST